MPSIIVSLFLYQFKKNNNCKSSCIRLSPLKDLTMPSITVLSLYYQSMVFDYALNSCKSCISVSPLKGFDYALNN